MRNTNSVYCLSENVIQFTAFYLRMDAFKFNFEQRTSITCGLTKTF